MLSFTGISKLYGKHDEKISLVYPRWDSFISPASAKMVKQSWFTLEKIYRRNRNSLTRFKNLSFDPSWIYIMNLSNILTTPRVRRLFSSRCMTLAPLCVFALVYYQPRPTLATVVNVSFVAQLCYEYATYRCCCMLSTKWRQLSTNRLLWFTFTLWLIRTTSFQQSASDNCSSLLITGTVAFIRCVTQWLHFSRTLARQSDRMFVVFGGIVPYYWPIYWNFSLRGNVDICCLHHNSE